MREVIGIDVGGTFIKAGAVSGEGRILRRAKVATGVEGGVAEIEERMAEVFRRLFLPGVCAAGVGVPGMVRFADGVVVRSPNIPPWRDYPAARVLSEQLGVPVSVDNDANMAALGEGWTGAGKGTASFLMITLGTGIGSGVILDGELWHGDTGRAGEFGHVVTDPGGAPCGCGGRGCVERYASASGIRRLAEERGLRLDVPELMERARGGDAAARGVFETAGRALGLALAAWFNLMDVRSVIVGGGALPALEPMGPHIRKVLEEGVYGVPAGELRITGALLGEDAGIVGAARAALAGGSS